MNIEAENRDEINEFKVPERCLTCYWFIKNKHCFNVESNECKHYTKYNPEKCIGCEHENFKKSPVYHICECDYCKNYDKYEKKHNWVFISNPCPECRKNTVISDGVFWVCGCGFEYKLQMDRWDRLRSESFIESIKKSTRYDNDYPDADNICDMKESIKEYAYLEKIDKYDFQRLIEVLTQITNILEFRLKGLKDPRYQRFCPNCHQILVKANERYFYCNNSNCDLCKKRQRGVEEDY